MADKKEIKQLDKIFKVYTSLQLHIGKRETFGPKDLTELVILGMKLMQSVQDLTGVEKKEKLISMIKLLIKEHSTSSEWIQYDLDLLNSTIDSLYKSGITKKKCCF